MALISCTKSVFENITIKNCGTDGIYLGENVSGVPNTDLIFTNVVCDNNSRQGVSIINARNILFRFCKFLNTNGKLPQAGVDLEPDNVNAEIDNIIFEHCQFRGNQGRGIVLQTSADFGTVVLNFCDISNNMAENIRVTGSGMVDNFKLLNSKVEGNNISLGSDTQVINSVYLINNDIKANIS